MWAPPDEIRRRILALVAVHPGVYRRNELVWVLNLRRQDALGVIRDLVDEGELEVGADGRLRLGGSPNEQGTAGSERHREPANPLGR